MHVLSFDIPDYLFVYISDLGKPVELENVPTSTLLIMKKECKDEIQKKDNPIETKELERDQAKVEIEQKEDKIREKSNN